MCVYMYVYAHVCVCVCVCVESVCMCTKWSDSMCVCECVCSQFVQSDIVITMGNSTEKNGNARREKKTQSVF